VISAEKNFLKKLRQRCEEVGALMILDECQTAFGRTGTLFCFEQYEIVPDVLLLAKSLGGGMPLGAFISSKERMIALSNNPALGHITTFGGHPVCCAAGKVAMEVLLEENLMEDVKRKSEFFKDSLHHPLIKNLHGAGLLMSLEFENEILCKKIVDACIENGVITDWFLFAPHCMRLAPPLIISMEEIHEVCAIILQSLNGLIESKK
jgi:acetylornithine/succinyldiaminopimelate/putrescine aminotransferase